MMADHIPPSKKCLYLFIPLFLPILLFSQSDTALLRTEIDKLLKKNGYKKALFELRVINDSNRKGTPAFAITNYPINYTNGKSPGQRHPNVEVLYSIISKLPTLSSPIKFLVGDGKESENYCNEIYAELKKRGYKNISGSHWMYPDGFDKTETKMQDSVLTIYICPASSTRK